MPTKRTYTTITLSCGHLELREDAYLPRIGEAVCCDMCPYIDYPLQSRVVMCVKHDPIGTLTQLPDHIDTVNWHRHS